MAMNKKSSIPPPLAEKILKGMNRSGEEYAFLGDLNEEYSSLFKNKGRMAARSWYWGQVLAGVPAFFKDSIAWSFHMFKNYLVITWRNVKRNKGFSFINIAGLVVGMAACLLILLWVKDELSFNRFHENIDNIYLAVSERIGHRGDFYGESPVPLGNALRKDFSEISKVVRFQFRRDVIARREEKIFNDWKGAYVDPDVFEAFTFPFVKGNAESALLNPDGVVLTQTAAQKLFSEANPVGRMMEIEGKLVEVTGILRDIPKNSDIQVDYFRPFLSMEEIAKFKRFIWNWFACDTYVVLKKGTDPASVNPKISGLLNANRPWTKDPLEVSLFPFKNLHLHGFAGGGPIQYIYIFTAVALMILLIACINFINLSTARSAKRAKEVGLRKIVGSERLQLIKQFFLESTFFAVVSAVLAVILAWLGMPLFNNLAKKQLRLDPSDAGMIFGLVGMVIMTGIAAGLYPALVLSSFQPGDVLKGNLLLGKGRTRGASSRGARFRQGLVITQFVLSTGLMVCALLVSKQLNYMRTADMGFDKDNLVRIAIPEKYKEKWEILKAGLSQSSHIAGVTAHSSLGHGAGIDWDNASADKEYLGDNTVFQMVDFDYISTHKMEIAAGRDFSREFPSDVKSAYLINEEAVKIWGFKDPVDKRFALIGAPGKVVGVYKNQHFGLRDDVMPCVLYLRPLTDWDGFQYLTARLKADHVPEALEDIKKTWKAQIADIPIDYHFVDEMIDALYQSEERLSGLIHVFTLLAVAISCLGLLAMASHTAQRKTKEIGVRKALGASVFQIIVLMTREIVRWVWIANMISWPIAFFIMRSWLNGYPYRIKIGLESFMISGLAALFFAILTVIYQAVKSASANPVNSLRYE